MSDSENPQSECLRQLSELTEMESGLSAWEADFIDSLLDQFDSKGTLTPRQVEKTFEIHKIRCVEGITHEGPR